MNKVYDFFFRRLDGMIALRKGLDTMSTRQKVIASNVANSETAGYNAKRVEFESELKKAFDRRSSGVVRTSSDHIPIRGGLRQLDNVLPTVVNDPNQKEANDINNVDIDMEMSRMATNQIQYATASKVMSLRYRMLKSSITGRHL